MQYGNTVRMKHRNSKCIHVYKEYMKQVICIHACMYIYV